MKTCSGSRSIAPLVRSLCTSWSDGQLRAPAALPRERTPLCKENKAGWNPELVWTVLLKIKSPAFVGIRTSDRPDHSESQHYSVFYYPDQQMRNAYIYICVCVCVCVCVCGKIKGQIEVTRRRGRRRKKLLDDLKDRRGYCQLEEEALDRTMWRNHFGRGFRLVV